jgi:lysophospholipase L1-like esterase
MVRPDFGANPGGNTMKVRARLFGLLAAACCLPLARAGEPGPPANPPALSFSAEILAECTPREVQFTFPPGQDAAFTVAKPDDQRFFTVTPAAGAVVDGAATLTVAAVTGQLLEPVKYEGAFVVTGDKGATWRCAVTVDASANQALRVRAGQVVYDDALPAIHLVGDSTMQDCQAGKAPVNGWGQQFPRFCRPGVRICNHARGGQSTRAFLSMGLWDKAVEQLRPGDVLIIQFGHNEAPSDNPAKFAEPRGAYRELLMRFVDETRAKGAVPVLATPINKRSWDNKGALIPSWGDYPEAMREVAREKNVPLLDLTEATRRLYTQYGPEASVALFTHAAPGEYPAYPNGVKDNVHLSALGAEEVAALAAGEAREHAPELAALLVP